MGNLMSADEMCDLIEKVHNLENRIKEVEMVVQKTMVLLELQQHTLEQQHYNVKHPN